MIYIYPRELALVCPLPQRELVSSIDMYNDDVGQKSALNL